MITDEEIPRDLPVSGRRGGIHLKRLNERADYLRKKIIEARPKELHYELAELGSLEWVIKTIILYEGLLKKE